MLRQRSSPLSLRLITKGLISSLLLVGFLSAANAQTSDFIREKVLKNVTAVCQERQLEIKPAVATPQVIQSYCLCNATYLADNLTDDQVFKFPDNTPPGPPEEILNAANKSCAAILKKG
jgi:hypothetical protein